MGPLAGLKVLDLSRVLAGPWAGQIFADLGAEVIKVERPVHGDDTRSWGPPFLKDKAGNETREATYFLSINRGKKSLCVDMSKPEGQAIIKKLAADSDILIENFKVGGLKKYGLDYESLKSTNPRLIYLSITGFGQDGPYAPRAGYDFIIQAMGGLMSVTGEPGEYSGGPQKVGIAVSDIFTGLYGVIGVLAALEERHRTGLGKHVDAALLDTLVSVMSNQNTMWLIGDKVPGMMGNAHATIVPYQSFKTRDSAIVLAVGNDHQYRHFMDVAADDRLRASQYATNPDRVRHRASLIPIIAEIMQLRNTADWLAALEQVGVPAGPINTVDKVFEDPQVKARGLQVALNHPLSGKVASVLNPFVFDGQRQSAKTAPPLLGANTDEILGALGYNEDELRDLNEQAVIQS